MTEVETLKALINKLRDFTFIEQKYLQLPNESQSFVAPVDKLWCRASIQYADSKIVAIGNKPCKRNFGIINIQCFGPKGSDTLEMAELCDAWIQYLEYEQIDKLEITIVHSPQEIQNDDFYGKLIRAEFRVN